VIDRVHADQLMMATVFKEIKIENPELSEVEVGRADDRVYLKYVTKKCLDQY
jgi:hypothetical protein